MNKSRMFFEKLEAHKNNIDELKYFNRTITDFSSENKKTSIINGHS